MSVVGEKMSDQFEEFFRQHGGQSCGEQKSEQAAKGEWNKGLLLHKKNTWKAQLSEHHFLFQ